MLYTVHSATCYLLLATGNLILAPCNLLLVICYLPFWFRSLAIFETEGVEKGGAGGREGEGPLILFQNSKMSSLVRARSLLSKLNTRLARGLASEPPWLTSSKLKGQNHVGSFFRSRRGGASPSHYRPSPLLT